jgi:hypothetical protein
LPALNINGGGVGVERIKGIVERRVVQFSDMLVNKRMYEKVCSKEKNHYIPYQSKYRKVPVTISSCSSIGSSS